MNEPRERNGCNCTRTPHSNLIITNLYTYVTMYLWYLHIHNVILSQVQAIREWIRRSLLSLNNITIVVVLRRKKVIDLVYSELIGVVKIIQWCSVNRFLKIPKGWQWRHDPRSPNVINYTNRTAYASTSLTPTIAARVKGNSLYRIEW